MRPRRTIQGGFGPPKDVSRKIRAREEPTTTNPKRYSDELLGNAFVVVVTLPMAILFSFLMMRLFGISSNIMSLAGISISVGILIDQAVVMGENAAHHLTRRFGREPVRGDTPEIVIHACRTVGR